MTRKIVLFVVEGPTDADLLLPAFNALLTRHDVRDEEFHCDMLTAHGIPRAQRLLAFGACRLVTAVSPGAPGFRLSRPDRRRTGRSLVRKALRGILRDLSSGPWRALRGRDRVYSRASSLILESELKFSPRKLIS